jgi:hypothetical protein
VAVNDRARDTDGCWAPRTTHGCGGSPTGCCSGCASRSAWPGTPVTVTVTVTVTASIGGTLAVAGDTPESLPHRADTAMYAAKPDGKDAVELSGELGYPAGV